MDKKILIFNKISIQKFLSNIKNLLNLLLIITYIILFYISIVLLF